MGVEYINILGVKKDSFIDGFGIRDVYFVAGCGNNPKCKGCQNPESWDKDSGKKIKIKDLSEEILKQNPIKNITISGGDPMTLQQQEVCELVKKIKKGNEQKNIWLYTGMTFEEILSGTTIQNEILKYIDVLVDGRYIEEERDITLKFRSNKSQRIINVQESLKQGKVIKYID